MSKQADNTGSVRIIGGQWRSRKLDVAAVTGLRPTPDRVRETLFNWLAPIISGAVCLDLYAGSGALGLEALSRGAASATLVEQDSSAVAALEHNCRSLGAESAQVIHADALQWLQHGDQVYDIVFLDPPFDAAVLDSSCELLINGGHLRDHACIYTETGPGRKITNSRLRTIKQATAGQVEFCLHTIENRG